MYNICHIVTLYTYNIIDKICHNISNNIVICKNIRYIYRNNNVSNMS